MCEYCDYEAEFARAYATGFDFNPDGSIKIVNGKPNTFPVGIKHPHVVDESKTGTAGQLGGATLGGLLPTGKGSTDPLGSVIGQKTANDIYNTPHNVVKSISDTVLGGANNIQHYIPILIAGGLAVFAIYLISKR